MRDRCATAAPAPRRPGGRRAAPLPAAVTALAVTAAALGGCAAPRATAPPEEQGPGGDAARFRGMAPPEIAYTRDGAVHVRAASLDAAYFGLGWATARDRAGQLELLRRAAEGDVSRLVGNGALQSDGFVRALGVMDRARALAATMRGRPFAGRVVTAYLAGLNARLDSLRAGLLPLPRDLAAAGVRPGRWTPAHVMAVALLQGLRLDADFPQLDHARLAERIGRERALASWGREPLVEYWTVEDSLVRGADSLGGRGQPTQPSPAAVPEPALARAAASGPAARALAWLAAAVPAGGPGASNVWAVGGARTRSGAALLANDTHLGFATPSTWYAAHLRVPDSLEVAGLTVPGLPFLSSGRNRDLAWGITALGAMPFEAYRESLDAAGKHVLFRGRWEPITSRPLGLRYRLGPLELPLFWMRARHTRHGVLAVTDRRHRRGYAIRWIAVEPWAATAGDFGWERARTLEEFRARLAAVFAPTLNWVVAERSGRILYQAAGWVPRRGYALTLDPTPAADGRHEWGGVLPLDSMPHAIRPAGGVVVNSNNHPAGRGPFPEIGFYQAAEYRAARVRTLLGARRGLTAGDLQAIQGDALSPQWAVFGPLLVARARRSGPLAPRERAALEALARWDGRALPGSAAPTIFRAWWNTLNAALVTPGRDGLLAAVLRGEAPESWFAPRAAGRGGAAPSPALDARVAGALREALDALAARLGPDPRGWDWDRTHRARFRHALAGRDATLTPRLVPMRGDRGSVLAAASSLPRDTVVTAGPSMRLVWDLGDSSGWFIVPPGNSGDPDSPHYADLLEAWSEVRYRRLDLAWPGAGEIERAGRPMVPVAPPRRP